MSKIFTMKNLTCECKKFNKSCLVWASLTTSPEYQSENGTQVPTMTGRREPLLFRAAKKNQKTVIHVWRTKGRLNFTFDEHDCQAICQRFEEGILKGRNFTEGGTSYFNAPDWDDRPLNYVTAPFAAAIIRHARQMVGLRNY
jgi:hypothetical protein